MKVAPQNNPKTTKPGPCGWPSWTISKDAASMTPQAMAFAKPAYNGASFSPFGSKKNGMEPRPVMAAMTNVNTKTLNADV